MTSRCNRRWIHLALAGTLCALLAGPVLAQEEEAEFKPVLNVGGVDQPGGTIKGIVKVVGEKKNRAPIRNMNVDPFCATHWRDQDPPLSESYVWGDNDTLQNVVVYVSKGLEGKEKPQLTEVARIDQHGCVYVPHVLAVMANQPVEIHNSDNTMHNVNFNSETNGAFNDAMVKGVVLKKTFTTAELKAAFKCNVHPWMGARLAVFDHPYFAVTQQDGTFEIKGLPAGEYEISTWHEIPVFKTDQPSYKVTVPAEGAAEVTVTYQLPEGKGK